MSLGKYASEMLRDSIAKTHKWKSGVAHTQCDKLANVRRIHQDSQASTVAIFCFSVFFEAAKFKKQITPTQQPARQPDKYPTYSVGSAHKLLVPGGHAGFPVMEWTLFVVLQRRSRGGGQRIAG